MEQQLVIFLLADEHYGVDIAAVESIIKLQTITKVPHSPPFVEGIINLRGQVIPVVDLRKRFSLNTREETRDTRVIVVELAGLVVGMIVDAVTEVIRVPQESIEPPSPLVTTINSAFITGIAKVEERLIILLDLGKILTSEETADLHSLTKNG